MFQARFLSKTQTRPLTFVVESIFFELTGNHSKDNYQIAVFIFATVVIEVVYHAIYLITGLF
jgi:hypothetical protein